MYKAIVLSCLVLVTGCEVSPTCLPTNTNFGIIESKSVTTTRTCPFRGPCYETDSVVYVIKRDEDGSMCHVHRLPSHYEKSMKLRGPL